MRSGTDDSERIAVVPIFPTENGVGHDTLLVKQWCPGYGSGDQPDAWCLGELSIYMGTGRSGLRYGQAFHLDPAKLTNQSSTSNPHDNSNKFDK